MGSLRHVLRNLRREVESLGGEVPNPDRFDPSCLSDEELDRVDALLRRREGTMEEIYVYPSPDERPEDLTEGMRQFYLWKLERKGPGGLRPYANILPRSFLEENAPELLETGPLSREEKEELAELVSSSREPSWKEAP